MPVAAARVGRSPIRCAKPLPTMAGIAPRALARWQEQRAGAMLDYLRQVVLAPPIARERGHAVFVDSKGCWRGDASCGEGTLSALSVRMRGLLREALRHDAAGIILAHSHPSGHCRPSRCDIAATRRLDDVARALDIVVIDHLIMTTDAIYSMRAGGLL